MLDWGGKCNFLVLSIGYEKKLRKLELQNFHDCIDCILQLRTMLVNTDFYKFILEGKCLLKEKKMSLFFILLCFLTFL